MSKPIIIDCDPGHDDVFAIWLAAAHPALNLRGITTVAGNGRIEDTTHNALVACTVAGIEGVPVSRGAEKPLLGELTPAEWIHGANALGGPQLPTPTTPLDGRDALNLMRDVVHSSDAPVTIVATGPLTNVALFIRQHPELLDSIGEVIWMGGSTGPGNVSDWAEFNAWTDPESIALVLDSGVEFTMVGLNVSHQALITAEVRRRIAAIGTRTAAFGSELLEFYCSTYAAVRNMPDGPLHDPITVALLADPAVATSVRSHINVELSGSKKRGTTDVDILDSLKRPANASVAVRLDVPRFWGMIEDAVRQLD